MAALACHVLALALLLCHGLSLTFFGNSVSLCCSVANCRLSLLVQATSISNPDATFDNQPVAPTSTRTRRKPEEWTRLELNQTLIHVIEHHVGSLHATIDASTQHPNDDWKRLKNYVYRNSGGSKRLSLSQVESVLVFLTQELDDMTLVRRVLQATPRILRKNVATQLRPTLDFLRRLYAPSAFLRHAIRLKPELLLTRGIGYTNDKDELHLMTVYLTQELKLTKTQVQTLQQGHGAFLFQTPMHKVLPIVEWFRELLLQGSRTDVGQKDDNDVDEDVAAAAAHKALQKLVVAHPWLLGLSLEDNLRPRVDYLRRRCHLEDTDLAVLLQNRAAGVLGLSVSENLAPTLDYLDAILRSNEDNDKNTLKACILSHPPILGLALDTNLKPKVSFLDAIDQRFHQNNTAERPRLASRVLKRAPAVFSLSLTENIQPTVRLLSRVWDCEDQLPTEAQREPNVPSTTTGVVDAASKPNSLAALLGEYPTLLTLSLQRNLMPTLSFFNKTGYITLDNEWRSVGRPQATLLRGRYVAASLYSRLLPRWHYLQEHGDSTTTTFANVSSENEEDKDKDEGKTTAVHIPIHLLACATDRAFCTQTKVDLKDYQRYKKEETPKLKFGSQLDSWMKSGTRIDV